MNNKGFTLIETLVVLVLVSTIMALSFSKISSSMSLEKNNAYQIMKNNIISASYSYIEECQAKTVSCDFSFSEKNTFAASVLKEKGYFKNLKSPLDGKDLGECLIIKAKKENGVVVIDIEDNCYL